MRYSISSWVIVQLTAAQMLLLSAAENPAVARLHYHHAAVLHHRAQSVISDAGSHATSGPGKSRTDTKPDSKGEATVGDETPPSDQANPKGQKIPHDTFHSDDRSNKSTGPAQTPIDTSISILGPPPNRANTHGWKMSKRKSGASSGVAKTSMQENKIRTKGTRIIRNAIGQPLIRPIDAKGNVVKNSVRPTVNGTSTPAHPIAAAGGNDVALVPHPKPTVPLAWSFGGPHDPPTRATPYRVEINGRDLIRIGAGTAAIAGAANLNTGVLSGSSFHPKLP